MLQCSFNGRSNSVPFARLCLHRSAVCFIDCRLAWLCGALAAVGPVEVIPCVRRTCKATKPLNEFHVDKRSSEKHIAWCKPCVKAYKQERSEKRSSVDPAVAKKLCRRVLQSHRPRVRRSSDGAARNAALPRCSGRRRI